MLILIINIQHAPSMRKFVIVSSLPFHVWTDRQTDRQTESDRQTKHLAQDSKLYQNWSWHNSTCMSSHTHTHTYKHAHTRIYTTNKKTIIYIHIYRCLRVTSSYIHIHSTIQTKTHTHMHTYSHARVDIWQRQVYQETGRISWVSQISLQSTCEGPHSSSGWE